ncbi:MAG: hypothetical protein JWL69_1416 [Phycisphaerales bacterium]|nr:hypothetical protein [Phycisphaerales bacterium]MDB5357952.1 hypothetical protein [Phycisphaerales bacterium]
MMEATDEFSSFTQNVGWAYSPTTCVNRWASTPTLHDCEEAQLDVRPLTLTLSPEYGGEGTGVGIGRAALICFCENRGSRGCRDDLQCGGGGRLARLRDVEI